jgi:hypothetical protein
MEIGYAFLQRQLGLPVFPVAEPAVVRPVQRVFRAGDGSLQVPRHVAPAGDTPLDHLLFALKHEGVNLPVLASALPRIDPGELVARLRESPSSLFVRKACFLWEAFADQTLEDIPAVGGNYGPLFDPERYVSGKPVRNSKWRIDFNLENSVDRLSPQVSYYGH